MDTKEAILKEGKPVYCAQCHTEINFCKEWVALGDKPVHSECLGSFIAEDTKRRANDP